MDESAKQRIRERIEKALINTDCENIKNAVESFMVMIEGIDQNPEVIREKFGELGKLNWPRHRNYYAELGMEVTPEEYQLYCDLYQMAISFWEEEILEGGH